MESKKTEKTTLPFYWKILLIIFVSIISHLAVINAPFMYDDEPALLFNADVQGTAPLSRLWVNDFWGAPIYRNSSHKSYRPITVLFFRCMHSVWGNWSTAFHVNNIILHSIVSVLFFLVCQRLISISFDETSHLVAGILFSLHPIHTEVVCGVVCCAELFSAACFMISLLLYSRVGKLIDTQNDKVEIQPNTVDTNRPKNKSKSENVLKETRAKNVLSKDDGDGLQTLRQRRKIQNVTNRQLTEETQEGKPVSQNTSWWPLTTSLAVATFGMFCKETSITVLGVLLICEFMEEISRKKSLKKAIFSFMDCHFTLRIILIFFWGFLTLVIRMKVMGWNKPSFDKVINPVPYEEDKMLRFLNYAYLCWFNFMLLVCPTNLSYDYSRGSIPLITSIWETRNLSSFLFLTLCLGLPIVAAFHMQHQVRWAKPFLFGSVLMMVSFLPASNVFISVGFVVAERVLYLPSTGFIILLVLLWQNLMVRFPSTQRFLRLAMAVLILFYFGQTINRSLDWTSEDRLFGYSEAAAEYKKAIEIDAGNYGAVINLANILNRQNSPPDKIEKLYRQAIEIEPRKEKAYANLAAFLMLRNQDDDAINVLAKAMKNVQSGFLKISEVARLLVAKTNQTQAKRIFYHLIKSSCFVVEHQPAMERCSKALVPALEDIVNQVKKSGEQEKAKSYEAQIAKINATDWDALDQFAKALSDVWTIEEAFFAMMRDIEDNKKDLKIVQESEANLWRRATNLFRNQRYKEGRKMYEILMENYPQNLEAKGQYAALLFETGEVGLAEKILESIINQDKLCLYTGAWHNLATLYGKQGNFVKAIDLLNTCFNGIKKNYDNKEPQLQKGQIILLCQLGKHEKHRSMQLKTMGKKKEADLWWKKALKRLKQVIKLDANNQEAQSALLRMENAD